MIGCKVMKTLASVKIEIMLILGLPYCLSSSSVRLRISLRILVDSRRQRRELRICFCGLCALCDDQWNSRNVATELRICFCVGLCVFMDDQLCLLGCLPQCLLTQRFPPRLTEFRVPECPYHFLRIPMRLLAPPTLLPESTPPTLVPILCRTACMAVRVQPAMSPGLSASMAEVTAMSESIFRKRFRSSYESSPSLSPPDLPLRKRYGRYYKMSTSVFVDLEISTQADGAQSSRVPIPLPKDPYEAIRQAYLDGTNTESKPFEDPVETETPKSPHTIAPPTSLPESTPPTLVPILRRTTCMVVRVPPAMSPGLSASMENVAAMSESAFHKRFRSSYESSPSSSLPDLPLRKRYWDTSELS
ncbi:hypothetical protein Tco_0677402 [Tanacetum coccineum]|uniref:Uncharacterized protein n=1 Tax=Tanacetum coccineum TaxID=301880 RepID=A0ABQ4XCY2_9ASTR